MKRWPVLGVALASLWVAVRRVPLDPATVASEFLIGLAVGLPIAFAFRRFYREEIDLLARLRALPYALAYVSLFLWELLTANVEVAYRVLAPSMPIRPGVIELPLRVETDMAITTIANSITLTPGTLTMDYDADRNAIYVHTLDGRDREAVVAPIRRWEDLALRIFDEDRDPGDPVPRAAQGGDPVVTENQGSDASVAAATPGAEAADSSEASGDGDASPAERADGAVDTGGDTDGE